MIDINSMSRALRIFLKSRSFFKTLKLRKRKRPKYEMKGDSSSDNNTILSNKDEKVLSGKMYDDDMRNAEILIGAHSNDPFEVIYLHTHFDSPVAKEPDDVVVRVEVTTVSRIDCQIRHGKFPWKYSTRPSFPMCPGIDCVGIITSVGSSAIKSGFDVGDRVAALLLNGCTAKYVKLKIDDVTKVSDDVDPAEAVVALHNYVPAFQCLLANVDGMDRYSRKPLKNDRVLVVGTFGVFERAVVELAIYLGAKRVYFCCITQEQSTHDTSIRMLGAKPLSMDPDDWSNDLEGMIDIAIETTCLDRYEHSYKSLTEDGILVPTGMHEMDKNNDWLSGIERGWVKTWAALNRKCYPYEGIVESYHQDKKRFKKDLNYVLQILEKKKIRPKVGVKIPMTKVAETQEKLDIHPESVEKRGMVVVEPWLLPQTYDSLSFKQKSKDDEKESSNTLK